eukprot:gene3676-4579_t
MNIESRIICNNKLFKKVLLSKGLPLLQQHSRYYSSCNINNRNNSISNNKFTTTKSINNLNNNNHNICKRFFRATSPPLDEKRDYYDVLGIPRNATKQQIKQAFYGLAKKFHPDANKEDPNASKKFTEINNAYNVLSDENKRAMYDAHGHQGAASESYGGGFPGGFQGGQEINLEDLFQGFNLEDLFGGGEEGGRGGRSQNGADVQVNMTIDFMEAVNGCEKEVSFYGGKECETCSGSGAKPGTKPIKCKTCNGTGMEKKNTGFFQMATTCRTCKGQGKTVKDHCTTCKGKGTTQGQRTLNIKIPQGINNGMNIKMAGQGEPPGPRGGRKGNLYVNVTVQEHELFKRQGNDIHLDVPITMVQATMGSTITIPTLTGEVDLKVPPGTQPNEKRVLKGKGIRGVNNMEYGNQYVHFVVSIPKNINEKQKELLNEFENEEKKTCGPLDSLTHPVLSFWNKAMKRWSEKFKKQ